MRRTIGLTLDEALRILHGIEDPVDRARLLRRVPRARRGRDGARTRASSTARTDVVAACRDAGFATAICSTKKRTHIEGVLERDGVVDLFDVVIGHEDVARAKPAPDALLAALDATRRRAPSARSTSAITRSMRKRRRARAFAFVAVLTGPSRRDEFGAHAVREFLASIDEVPRVLRELAKR